MIFVAEVGSNHKGKLSVAYEMIRQSKLAGADIVKFQLGHWKPSNKYDPKMKQWIRYMPNEWVHRLKVFCDHWDIEFMASVFSTHGLELAKSAMMMRYKLASREAFESHSREDYDLFAEKLLDEGREVFATGRTHSWRKNIRPIYAQPLYPTYPTDLKIPVNFNSAARTSSWYGYSSHFHGIEDALVAIARGAQYIEKHVTLNKLEDSIKDHGFALSFDEFDEMVRTGRGMARICSSS